MTQGNLQKELENLRVAIEEVTGLVSRWNGDILLSESVESEALRGRGVLAEKLWSCAIRINTDLADNPIRWRTLLHEMIHSVSAGMNQENYRRFRGWEEAVIEKLQRLLRPQVLERLNVTIPEEIFQQAEENWLFNDYINAVESLREFLERESLPFYLDLLRCPLGERLGYVYHLSDSADYRRLFAYASGKLR